MAREITTNAHNIRMDAQGRYCLDDVRKTGVAAALRLLQTETVHEFMRCPETYDMLEALNNADSRGIEHVSRCSRKNREIFATERVVDDYALWLSVRFFLILINSYDPNGIHPIYHPSPCENASAKDLLVNLLSTPVIESGEA